jgi:outer membrane protein assembly factor BamD
MKRLSITAICILILCLAAACGKVKEEKTADQLAEEGLAAFEKEKYQKSIEAFEKLRDWYPFSKHAMTADQKIADAHFYMEEYEEAVIAYEDFERLHPRNEAIPLVIYRIGLCHFNRLDTIDRDQAPAEKALDAFYRLRRQYADSEYAEKAAAHIVKCRESLAAHDLYVGKFYFKSKHYKSALDRFGKVVNLYPDVGDVQTAEQYIALCLEKMNADTENQEKEPVE